MLRDIVKHKTGCALVLKNREEISYEKLEILSSAMADRLLQMGANKNAVMPVFVDNSLETIVFAIACWKVGAIYTPLNKDLPGEIIESMLKNLKCDYIFYTNKAPAAIEYLGLNHSEKLLSDIEVGFSFSENHTLRRLGGIKQIAVIIHTSGSTGTPKASCWSEASVVSFFDSYNDTMGYDEDSIGINNGPFYFDIVFQDTFIVLFYGGRVVLHDRRFIPSRFVALLNDARVTHMAIMSSTLQAISKQEGGVELHSMKKIMAGGEVGSIAVFEMYDRAGVTIYNGYGPTENNSLSGRYKFDSERIDSLIPIGLGFKNVDMVLLGDDGAIAESNTTGQILLGGNQLMEGYVDSLEIDQSVFLDIDGKRYYPTGDFGFYDDHNNMVFEGRRDQRVKLNGNRFSLTTIYSALSNIDGVSYAFVNTARKGEELFIIAAVTLTEQAEQGSKSAFDVIRAALKGKLANFMLPRHIFLFKELPYKHSQKADEKTITLRIAKLIEEKDVLPTTTFVNVY